MSNKSSYTAANAFPIKLLKMGLDGIKGKNGGLIKPIHVQISPTNKCNLNCSFCSCAKRGERDEMDIHTLVRFVGWMRALGTKAVTITGGGEPLMYQHKGLLAGMLYDAGIKMGLVTNGVLLKYAETEFLEKQTWCRISVSDDRDIDRLLESTQNAVERAPDVDWAFSYVVTKEWDIEKINAVVDFANQYNFTHVRIVSDLLDLDSTPDMLEIKRIMRGYSDRVILQGRKEFEVGQKDCWISLLKPVVAADGKIYPCCGVQYAKAESALDFDKTMTMGNDMAEVHYACKPFDGSECVRCYYGEYNRALDMLISDIDHEDFV